MLNLLSSTPWRHMGEWMYVSLTAVLIRSAHSASLLGRVTHGEIASGTNWIGCWVSPKTGPVSCYTDCALYRLIRMHVGLYKQIVTNTCIHIWRPRGRSEFHAYRLHHAFPGWHNENVSRQNVRLRQTSAENTAVTFSSALSDNYFDPLPHIPPYHHWNQPHYRYR